jgi:polyisoprenoid-binding protein YceI
MKIQVVLTALSLCASLSAHATEYGILQADKSSLGFTYKQMNVPVDGGFKRFKAQLSFDPAQPAKASAAFDIEVASIDVGSAEGNGEVSGKLWFNTASFPVARFVSTSVKSLGNNRFEIAGKLTVKGKTQDVVAPVSFRQDGANGVFEGALSIRRADYAIGEGMWADFGTVANEVQIRFRLVAAPKK